VILQPKTVNNLTTRVLALLQHLQPAMRVQFGLGAVLHHSNTPSLRVAGFEDEDDDDDEYEAPCELRRDPLLVVLA
jgi:hypothetical protein